MYKVLVAEDEEFILQGIANLIEWEELGLAVNHLAANGTEALEQWKQEPSDIVITDINMPIMDGLELLKAIREVDNRTRFIIISGYDEFEYARTAIRLDVENYILKPIDEDQMTEVLGNAVKKLETIDRESKNRADGQARFGVFLSGRLNEPEVYISRLNLVEPAPMRIGANMKVKFHDTSTVQILDIITYLEKRYKAERMQVFSYEANELMLIADAKEANSRREFFMELQDEAESEFDISTFITIGNPFTDYMELPEQFCMMNKLEKYRLILGYGSCVDEEFIRQRHTKDITIDQDKFHKMILARDKQGITDYLEDLFINNARKGGASVNDIYRMTLKIALILQEIIEEYQLFKGKELRNITEMIDELYEAEDIFMIKAMFIAEAIEIIDLIHEEDCQYTPVVRQVLSEVKNHYSQEMNLKTLAYKYHINTSYLGQIFQKEVGCSFSQYLSNIKNSKARELILNTNMKINDIAKEVGYPDTSYFYRKFKQCYGVSPASLREMKKY